YNLTYMKGGMILHLLRWQIGDKAFFDGIRNYLRDPKLAYSYATVDDLKHHFEEMCNCDLSYFFDDWYYGEGYPIYEIYWWQTADNQLFIEINQTNSALENNFFELNIPIKTHSNYTNDSILILNNTEQSQVFIFQLNYKISNLIFDPETWILTRNSVVTKIIKNINDIEVTISPNPATNKININFPIETTVLQYTIYDTLGREFAHKTINKRTDFLTINIRNINSGEYIINIKTLDGFVSKKFIKE
ncbi:MAG: T9SS type A sorting domain-containing protein, partial [Bacteroidota bacterium]|nr:T9SS type A sorting domain-containing protein [Bacteroidota bacterium]